MFKEGVIERCVNKEQLLFENGKELIYNEILFIYLH